VVPAALTYRARLRTEGLALAACGAAGSAALLLTDDRATQNAGSTVGQLLVVLVLLAVLGPLSVRRAIAHSTPAKPAGTTEPRPPAATGEPTPLWHLPLVVAVLTLPLVALGAWDAGLRVTGGCTLVGLAQALLLAHVVHAHERATGRIYVRASGSRILRGTRLAHEQSRA
jgi:hypothetical protein